MKCAGLGGVGYICNGCVSQTALLETSAKYELTSTSEVSTAVQVAFLVAGCTYKTYYKTLKHSLGIDAVEWHQFQSTIARMYPIVKLMVDTICEEANQEMKDMDHDELGSWSRAVTSADDTWFSQYECYIQHSKLLYWSSSLSQAPLSEWQRLS